ncbi:MAG: carbohydrate deacetylase [Thermoguttaceae bacterium]
MTTPESAVGSPSPAGRSRVRQVALHADDLGMNPAVTDGIFQGFEQGLLTSTSLLSNAPDAAQALDRWRQLASRRSQGSLPSMARRERLQDPAQPFDLGIHLNLTQGRPLIGSRYPAELLDTNGCFPGIFGLFRRLRRSGEAVAAAIEEELTCQAQFMLDRGHQPTHLNGHQYIEMLPVVTRVVESLLEEFRIPAVRVAWERSWWKSFTWPGISATQWLIGGLKKAYAGRFHQQMLGKKVFFADAFFGTMTAGTTSLETIHAFLAAMRDFHTAEIGLHPAARPDAAAKAADGWRDPLVHWRPRELEMVISVELEELFAASGCRLGRLSREAVA